MRIITHMKKNKLPRNKLIRTLALILFLTIITWYITRYIGYILITYHTTLNHPGSTLTDTTYTKQVLISLLTGAIIFLILFYILGPVTGSYAIQQLRSSVRRKSIRTLERELFHFPSTNENTFLASTSSSPSSRLSFRGFRSPSPCTHPSSRA